MDSDDLANSHGRRLVIDVAASTFPYVLYHPRPPSARLLHDGPSVTPHVAWNKIWYCCRVYSIQECTVYYEGRAHFAGSLFRDELSG